MSADVYLSLETDPLDASFSMRIPESTKEKMDKLSKAQKKALNEQLLITIAKFLHESDFEPSKYLKS